jgi:hypothetical protein
MKNKLLIASLLIVIIVTFGFVGLKLAALGSDDNYFNRHLRPHFARSPAWRQILGLHYDGDGAADYLGTRYDSIAIAVVSEVGIDLAPDVLSAFAQHISDITGKPVSHQVFSNLIPIAEARSKSPIELAKIYRRVNSTRNAAPLFVLLLNAEPKDAKLLGSTLAENGIVLYVGALVDFTTRFPKTLANYELSTLLHEFGHQIGLGHNEVENCLMNPRVEHAESFIELPSDVIVDFCPFEKNLIKLKWLAYHPQDGF